jgi:hypothetical protein
VIENNYGGGYQGVICENETVIAINNIIRGNGSGYFSTGLFGNEVYAINNTVDTSNEGGLEVTAEHAAVYNNIFFGNSCYPDY